MIGFRLAHHSIHEGVVIVEIWDGGRMIGTIYPGNADERSAVRVVTKYPVDTSIITDRLGLSVAVIKIAAPPP